MNLNAVLYAALLTRQLGDVWMDSMLYRNILSNNIFLRLSASIEHREYMHTYLPMYVWPDVFRRLQESNSVQAPHETLVKLQVRFWPWLWKHMGKLLSAVALLPCVQDEV